MCSSRSSRTNQSITSRSVAATAASPREVEGSLKASLGDVKLQGYETKVTVRKRNGIDGIDGIERNEDVRRTRVKVREHGIFQWNWRLDSAGVGGLYYV